MSKNILFWIIGMIFVIGLVLPFAYAQEISGASQLILVGINSAVAAVALFILQVFMIPKKDGKEKSVVWFVVLATAIFIGWYFGRTNFIWRVPPFSGILEIHVIVNALIIGIVLYFGLGLLGAKEKLGKSPEAETGYGILIAIGAIVWAIGIFNSYGPLFIWNAYSYFISYFIGPEGILNPYPPAYRLLVLVGSFALISFFFSQYLFEGSAHAKINNALAAILAMNMASSGVSVRSVIILGEIIFVLVLQRSLQKTTGERVWLSWFIAILLVGWASSAMTYGTEFEGVLGKFIGAIWKYGGWGAVVALAIIIALVSFGIGRGAIGQNMSRLWTALLQRIRRNRALSRIVGDYVEARDPFFEGEIQPALRNLRIETFNLFNYMLRFEIYKFKASKFRETVDTIEEEEKIMGRNITTKSDIFNSIKNLVEGSRIIDINNGEGWDLEPTLTEDESGDVKELKVLGFGRQYYLILKVMELLKELLETDLTKDLKETSRDAESKKQIIIDSTLEPAIKNIESIHKRYNTALNRFGVYNKIRGHRVFFLDMYNYYGFYLRGYHFPKPDAIPELYTYTPTKKDGGLYSEISKKTRYGSLFTLTQKQRYENLRISYSSRPSSLTPTERSEFNAFTQTLRQYNFVPGTDFLEEVDIYGFSTRDQNDICIENKQPQFVYIRRWKREDIQEVHKEKGKLPRMTDLFNFSAKEWEFLVEDMEKGKYHPYSKRISDYDYVLKGHMDFEASTFKRKLMRGEIAFDREALKNPSKMYNFWGKKNYFDTNPDTMIQDPASPYPCISLVGLWKFIWDVAGKTIKVPDETRKFRELYKQEFEDIERAAQETKK